MLFSTCLKQVLSIFLMKPPSRRTHQKKIAQTTDVYHYNDWLFVLVCYNLVVKNKRTKKSVNAQARRKENKMEYTNKMTIIFRNNVVAKNAKKYAAEGLIEGSFDFNYEGNPSEEIIKDFIVKNNSLILDGSKGYFLPEDMENVVVAMLGKIASALPAEQFTFDSWTSSTYSESDLAGAYLNGKLTINTIYYPTGYLEDLVCPECETIIDTVKNYDARKHYICPICGEELDFSDEVPEYKTTKIEIA